MRLVITHSTRYTFDEPVVANLQQVRLTPGPSSTQTISSWDLEIEGGHIEVHFDDQHGNRVHLVRATVGTTGLAINCTGEVQTHSRGGAAARHGDLTPLWLYRRQTALTRPGPAIREIALGFDESIARDVAAVHALSASIRESVSYEIGATTVIATAEEALVAGAGVCQDHAHIFISAARSLGLPARYVSGYLMMDDRVDQDATHAWAEAWVEELGWVGFDISNSISPDERYVHIARGLDYREAAPVAGIRTGRGGEHLNVGLQVQQQ